MPSLDDSLPALVEALTGLYGRPEPRWSGLEPFEALVATLLDRAFDPPKVDRALEALRDGGLLDPTALAESDPAELGEALRSAGLNIQDKALVPLRRVARWLVELHHGDTDALVGLDSEVPTARLREELLAVNGVGPSSADSLLLFGLGRAVYPLDRASYRVFVRHGWLEPTADYDEARDAVERLARDDPRRLGAFSVWFERLGREFCRATVAKCEKCPLKPLLPDSGPVEPA